MGCKESDYVRVWCKVLARRGSFEPKQREVSGAGEPFWSREDNPKSIDYQTSLLLRSGLFMFGVICMMIVRCVEDKEEVLCDISIQVHPEHNG